MYCHVSCLIGLTFDAIQSGARGVKPPGKAGGFGGPPGPPMREVVGGGGTVNGFWGMVPSWGMVKVGLMAGGRAGGRMGGWADGRMRTVYISNDFCCLDIVSR